MDGVGPAVTSHPCEPCFWVTRCPRYPSRGRLFPCGHLDRVTRLPGVGCRGSGPAQEGRAAAQMRTSTPEATGWDLLTSRLPLGRVPQRLVGSDGSVVTDHTESATIHQADTDCASRCRSAAPLGGLRGTRVERQDGRVLSGPSAQALSWPGTRVLCGGPGAGGRLAGAGSGVWAAAFLGS